MPVRSQKYIRGVAGSCGSRREGGISEATHHVVWEAGHAHGRAKTISHVKGQRTTTESSMEHLHLLPRPVSQMRLHESHHCNTIVAYMEAKIAKCTLRCALHNLSATEIQG
jgi:hypothetical protein